MDPRAGQTEDLIAGPHAARQQGPTFGRSYREARKVIVTRGVQPWELGGFSPYQGTAGFPTAVGDPGDNGTRLLHREPSRCEVIEKEQWLRPLNHEVVHAHRDEIDSDCAVDTRLNGDLELGADAIRGCDQHRIDITGGLRIE